MITLLGGQFDGQYLDRPRMPVGSLIYLTPPRRNGVRETYRMRADGCAEVDGQWLIADIPEQPHMGGFCDGCGHFAMRHNEDGCHGVKTATGCSGNCKVMLWCGVEWPRPWLPAPEGLIAA